MTTPTLVGNWVIVSRNTLQSLKLLAEDFPESNVVTASFPQKNMKYELTHQQVYEYSTRRNDSQEDKRNNSLVNYNVFPGDMTHEIRQRVHEHCTMKDIKIPFPEGLV